MDISETGGSNEDEVCIICQNPEREEQLVRLGPKGCDGLIEVCRRKGDCLDVKPGQHVHKECRKSYCHPNNDRSTRGVNDSAVQGRITRSDGDKFDFQKKCLFCGTFAKAAKGKRGEGDVYLVRTFDFQSTIQDFCRKRHDEWGETVLGRIEYAQDLPAIEARYHQKCSINFRTGYNIPLKYQQDVYAPLSKKGRPSNLHADAAFEQILHYLDDNINDQMTVLDLVSKMQELCGDVAYSFVYMKKKLVDHFGCEIVISEVNGKQNVITHKTTADSILHSFHRKSKNGSTDSGKNDIIKTAAKLIIEDIKTIEFQKENYPSSEDIMSLENNKKYIPSSLLLFLQQLIDSKNCDTKVVAIAQSIVQGYTPRGAILPLQLGLGVQMHHHFGSKFLIDTLHSLGFCSSYTEVQRYEVASATKWNIEMEKDRVDQTVQFVADNVDHNIGTIDGHNTFHGMGIIATITPGIKCSRTIPRVRASIEDVLSVGRINIRFYNQHNTNQDKLMFQSLHEASDVESDTDRELEFLANIARPLKIESPSWSGFMQTIQTGKYPGKSSVMFLPMIDLNPSDLTCIFSTLEFVSLQAKKLAVSPIITFDQPLYWKALQIILNEPEDSTIRSVVVRLGGFHTQMSFLGCIGQLMQNTGLQELIENVYAPNAVTQMLSGKAVSRAVRAHILVGDALNCVMMRDVLPEALRTEPSNITDIDNTSVDENNEMKTIQDLKSLCEGVLSREVTLDSLHGNSTLRETMNKYGTLMSSLECYRTAKLWMQYMDMIDILKTFVKAERTGNWDLHLSTMRKMLPHLQMQVIISI